MAAAQQAEPNAAGPERHLRMADCRRRVARVARQNQAWIMPSGFAAPRAIGYGPGFARCPGTRDRIAERNEVKKFQSRASCLIARFNGRQASITAALAQPRALTALV